MESINGLAAASEHVPADKVEDFDPNRDQHSRPDDPHAGITRLVAEELRIFWTRPATPAMEPPVTRSVE